MVSTTYGRGTLQDCNDVTGWSETEDGNTGATTVDNVTYFKIVVSASAGNEAYYWSNDTNFGLSSTTYTTVMWRYKTSDTSIKAKIVLEFSDANTQEVLADASSTTFTTGSATITSGKTIDHIRLHADHATGTVWYDFVYIYTGTFTLPQVDYMELHFPPRYASLPMPTKVGSVRQNLGSEDAFAILHCNLDQGGATDDWKLPQGTLTPKTDTIDAQLFFHLSHYTFQDPWQWWSLGPVQFKGHLVDPYIRYVQDAAGKVSRLLIFRVDEYLEGDGGDETDGGRFNYTA